MFGVVVPVIDNPSVRHSPDSSPYTGEPTGGFAGQALHILRDLLQQRGHHALPVQQDAAAADLRVGCWEQDGADVSADHS